VSFNLAAGSILERAGMTRPPGERSLIGRMTRLVPLDSRRRRSWTALFRRPYSSCSSASSQGADYAPRGAWHPRSRRHLSNSGASGRRVPTAENRDLAVSGFEFSGSNDQSTHPVSCPGPTRRRAPSGSRRACSIGSTSNPRVETHGHLADGGRRGRRLRIGRNSARP